MKRISVTILLIGVSFYSYAQETTTDSLAQTKEIQELIIKSQRKKQYTDHASYTFDKEALEKARHSKDLLETLPELQLDPISNTIISIKGGKTLFLVNGVEATDNQIKSIAPTHVVRVEYFDIPPARYSQRADTVVNIITRNPEVGYSYGADIISAISTGFVNGSAYADYTKGKHDFGVEYSINYRDYNNRIVYKIYDYDLNNSHYNSTEQQKDHFGYTTQNITLRYAHVVSGNYTFQAKANLFINSSFNKGIGKSIFMNDNLVETHHTIHNSNSGFTAPNLDLYYFKNIGKKDELSLNLIGAQYTTNSSQFDHEWAIADNRDVFRNEMNLKATQNELIGEVAHTHQFEKGKLSSGYRTSNTAISNDLVNLLGTSQYSVNYLTQYVYTEYSSKWHQLSYRIGIGIINIHNKSAETTQNNWSPTSKLILSYNLAKNQSLRLTTDYTSQSPLASALSPNIVQVVPNIYRSGNPFLKPKHMFRNNLTYSYSNKYLDVNATVFYHYHKNDIVPFYMLDNSLEGYVLRNINADFTQQIGGQISGSVKPFGNEILVIKPFLQYSNHLLKKYHTELKHHYLRNGVSINSKYKSLSVQYGFIIPVYMLNGTFLSTNENANNFFINYRLKNWSFTTGIYWIGTPSEYKTKTIPESLVSYHAHTKILNNKNMFTFGLSYDFSSGKKLQMQKKLENQTSGAVIF